MYNNKTNEKIQNNFLYKLDGMFLSQLKKNSVTQTSLSSEID